MAKCSNCGHEFEGVFCPYCGTKGVTDVCAFCGNPLAEGAEFCSHCGKRKGEQPVKETVSKAPVMPTPKPKAVLNSEDVKAILFGISKKVLYFASAVVSLCFILCLALPAVSGPIEELLDTSSLNFFSLLDSDLMNIPALKRFAIVVICLLAVTIAMAALGVYTYFKDKSSNILIYLPKFKGNTHVCLAIGAAIAIVLVYGIITIIFPANIADRIRPFIIILIIVFATSCFYALFKHNASLSKRYTKKKSASDETTPYKALSLNAFLMLSQMVVLALIIVVASIFTAKLKDMSLGLVTAGAGWILLIVMTSVCLAVTIAATIIFAISFFTSENIQKKEYERRQYIEKLKKIPMKLVSFATVFVVLMAVLIIYRPIDYLSHMLKIHQVSIGQTTYEVEDLLGRGQEYIYSNGSDDTEKRETIYYYSGTSKPSFEKYKQTLETLNADALSEETKQLLEDIQKKITNQTKIEFLNGKVVSVVYDRNYSVVESIFATKEKEISKVKIIDENGKKVKSCDILKTSDNATYFISNLDGLSYKARFSTGGFHLGLMRGVDPRLVEDKKAYIEWTDAFGNCKALITPVVSTLNSEGIYEINQNTSTVTNAFFAPVANRIVEIKVGKNVTKINGDAFLACQSLIKITVDEDNEIYSIVDGNLYSNAGKVLIYYLLGEDSHFEVPEGVAIIGKHAFRNRTTLTNITIPKSVVRIEEDAFYGCTSIDSVYIEDVTNWCNIKFVNSYSNPLTNEAALYCDDQLVTEVVFPDNTTAIGDYIFHGYTPLESITIPASVETIGEKAFMGCKIKYASVPTIALSQLSNEALEKAIIVGGSYIEKNAFNNCRSLVSITLPDTIISIGDGAFYYCNRLTSVTIPDNVNSIGDNAFYNCSSLTSITIPDSVKNIGRNAFHGCSSLENVEIGNNVTSIGISAFEGCASLTTITIPDSVTLIASSAFASCSSLTSITIPFVGGERDPKQQASHFGFIFGAPNYESQASYVPSNLKTVVITGGSSIGEYAFYDCTTLHNVVIKKEITSIDDLAFYGCVNITSVTIPEGLTSIGDNAFYGCFKLVEVINKSDLYIQPGSNDNGLIGYYAKEVHSGDSKIASQDGYLFYSYGGVNYLIGYIGKETVLTLPENYNGESYAIYDNAFYNHTTISRVIIPDGVTSIGEYAFSDCTRLTRVIIPDSVTSIGKSAFLYCFNLTIYCEATSKPSGWDSNWNYSNRPVVWGYVIEE